MTGHRFLAKFTALSVVILLLGSISACGGSVKENDVKIPKMSEERAKSVAEEYGRRIVEGIGAPKVERKPSSSASPCGNVMEGKDSTQHHFWMKHVQNVVVSPQEQVATYLRARTVIEGMGFKIRDFATDTSASGGAGRLRAMNSADGFSIALETTTPSEEIMIMISSPCLERLPEWEGDVSAGPSAGRTP
ncbi:hypothetical protein [Embleya scabrispora]|uniref:hypothetical protein n=1 Tax=Embleya scabrispora TaxID=159449 RepID=UPI001319F4C1|nr:hypothetical protein [Embleya scabrispora]MYS85266.1 hypothetical protein [Streptomyces sp. SID5474]